MVIMRVIKNIRIKTIVYVIVPAAILLTLPLWIKDVLYLHTLVMIGLFMMSALGVRLMLSGGHWNLGQGGFMTIGAYTGALLATHFNIIPFWGSGLLAGLIAAGIALALGYPIVKAKGFYFAIATLAFGVAVRQVIVAFPELTGGSWGLFDIIGPPLLQVDVSKIPAYYATLGLFSITLLVMYRIEHSRLGAVLKSISQSEILALSAGIDTTKYKVIAFAISSFFAGVAGAFAAHYSGVAHPDFFGLWQSFDVLVYVIFGGAQSILGTVLGTSILYSAMETLRIAVAFRALIYALIIVIIILFFPGGVVSLPGIIRKRLYQRRHVQEVASGGRSRE